MRQICLTALVIGLLVMQGVKVGAQEQQTRRPSLRGADPQAVVPSQTILDRLELTAAQKEKVAKLQEAFLAKNKDSLSKLKDDKTRIDEAAKKAREDKDRAALKTISGQFADLGKQAASLRSAVDEEILKELNADQKKKYQELRSESGQPAQAR